MIQTVKDDLDSDNGRNTYYQTDFLRIHKFLGEGSG